MLKEAELDRFLDEFFDGTMPVQSEEKNTDESTEDLEEYTLPTDGLIIRQMKRDGKVSRRTWAALALMVIIVPEAVNGRSYCFLRFHRSSWIPGYAVRDNE